MARQISSLQRRRVSRLQSDVSTFRYFTDEESDDSHISLDESLAFMLDDLESDGKMILMETPSLCNLLIC